MAHELVCWKCGAALAALSLPFGRRDACPVCRAELHVCRMCRDFDPRVADQCREPTADIVSDKERANFCDHYQPRPEAWQGGDDSAAVAARRELEKLFGQ